MGCAAGQSKKRMKEVPSFTISSRRSTIDEDANPTIRYIKSVGNLSSLLNKTNHIHHVKSVFLVSKNYRPSRHSLSKYQSCMRSITEEIIIN